MRKDDLSIFDASIVNEMLRQSTEASAVAVMYQEAGDINRQTTKDRIQRIWEAYTDELNLRIEEAEAREKAGAEDILVLNEMLRQGSHVRAGDVLRQRIGANRIRAKTLWDGYMNEFINRCNAQGDPRGPQIQAAIHEVARRYFSDLRQAAGKTRYAV